MAKAQTQDRKPLPKWAKKMLRNYIAAGPHPFPHIAGGLNAPALRRLVRAAIEQGIGRRGVRELFTEWAHHALSGSGAGGAFSPANYLYHHPEMLKDVIRYLRKAPDQVTEGTWGDPQGELFSRFEPLKNAYIAGLMAPNKQGKYKMYDWVIQAAQALQGEENKYGQRAREYLSAIQDLVQQGLSQFQTTRTDLSPETYRNLQIAEAGRFLAPYAQGVGGMPYFPYTRDLLKALGIDEEGFPSPFGNAVVGGTLLQRPLPPSLLRRFREQSTTPYQQVSRPPTLQGGQTVTAPRTAPSVPNVAAMGMGPVPQSGGSQTPMSVRPGPGARQERMPLRERTGLPLNPMFEEVRRVLEDNLQRALAQIEAERQLLQPQADVTLARLATEQARESGLLDERMIGRGILRSGIRDIEQNWLSTLYDRRRQDIAFALARALQELASREGEARLAYNQGLMDLMLRIAAQEAANPSLAIPMGGAQEIVQAFMDAVQQAAGGTGGAPGGTGGSSGGGHEPNYARIQERLIEINRLIDKIKEGGVTAAERERLRRLREQRRRLNQRLGA